MGKDFYIVRTPSGESAAVNGELDNRRALNILRLLQSRTSASVFTENLRNYGDVGRLLDELSDQGFIEISDANGKRYPSVDEPSKRGKSSESGSFLSGLFKRKKKAPKSDADPVVETPDPSTVENSTGASTTQETNIAPTHSEAGIPLPSVEYGISEMEVDHLTGLDASEFADIEVTDFAELEADAVPEQGIEDSFLNKYAPKVAERAKGPSA